jgi:hypothetical protein
VEAMPEDQLTKEQLSTVKKELTSLLDAAYAKRLIRVCKGSVENAVKLSGIGKTILYEMKKHAGFGQDER